MSLGLFLPYTAATEIYTLSLHDALPILNPKQQEAVLATDGPIIILAGAGSGKTRVLTYRVLYLMLEKHIEPESILMITFTKDRKSTRLNSSHITISYAVFCLKKKIQNTP